MRAVRTSPAVPVSRGKKQEKVSIAHRLRRSDVLLFLAAVALGGIGVLAIYAAEADYRQLYAVNQAIGLVAGLVGAVVLALAGLQVAWAAPQVRLRGDDRDAGGRARRRLLGQRGAELDRGRAHRGAAFGVRQAAVDRGARRLRGREQSCAQPDFPESARHHVRTRLAGARATGPRDRDGVRGHLRCRGLRGRSQVVPAWGAFRGRVRGRLPRHQSSESWRTTR